MQKWLYSCSFQSTRINEEAQLFDSIFLVRVRTNNQYRLAAENHYNATYVVARKRKNDPEEPDTYYGMSPANVTVRDYEVPLFEGDLESVMHGIEGTERGNYEGYHLFPDAEQITKALETRQLPRLFEYKGKTYIEIPDVSRDPAPEDKERKGPLVHESDLQQFRLDFNDRTGDYILLEINLRETR